ncbi:MAG: SLBB domain-containing protein [Armatimonadetes bacterium]|nr:SLBB domain-containing protein [Candidatus Hippobium faecium]
MKKIFSVLALLLIAGLCYCYNLGAGDVLPITSVNVPEINGNYIVSPDGFITVQYAGMVLAQDKSVEEITVAIKDQLKSRIKNPEIYINIVNAKNSVVFVTGWVKNPGSVNINKSTKLLGVISQVGGINYKESDTAINNDIVFIIKSQDGTKTEVLYKDLIDCDYQLKNGDIISADIKGKINVNVVGKVNTPGRYTLTDKNNTIMGAIVAAGGFTADADYSQVKIYSLDANSRIEDLSGYMDGTVAEPESKIEDNVTIIVPELIAGVTVIGWVNSQGKQTYRPNEKVYLADVIANAGGGVRNKARFNEVYVLRNVNGELTKTSYNFNNFQKKGDIAGNPEIKFGDVVFMPCTTAIDWSVVVSSIRGLISLGKDIKDM